MPLNLCVVAPIDAFLMLNRKCSAIHRVSWWAENSPLEVSKFSVYLLTSTYDLIHSPRIDQLKSIFCFSDMQLQHLSAQLTRRLVRNRRSGYFELWIMKNCKISECIRIHNSELLTGANFSRNLNSVESTDQDKSRKNSIITTHTQFHWNHLKQSTQTASSSRGPLDNKLLEPSWSFRPSLVGPPLVKCLLCLATVRCVECRLQCAHRCSICRPANYEQRVLCVRSPKGTTLGLWGPLSLTRQIVYHTHSHTLLAIKK